MKIIVEVGRSIPQEVEDIVEVFVPQIHEPIVEAVIPDKHLSQRDEILFLQTEEIGEVIQTFRQERIQLLTLSRRTFFERIRKQIEDVTAPQILDNHGHDSAVAMPQIMVKSCLRRESFIAMSLLV